MPIERDGIVSRTAYDQMPTRVDYELTPLGRTLQEPLTAVGRWAEQHIEAMLIACDRYGERNPDRLRGGAEAVPPEPARDRPATRRG